MGKLKFIKCLDDHRGKVWNICWHNDGKKLASCGEDKTIRIWQKEENNNNWLLINTISNKHSRTIRQVSWSPNGDILAACSFDSTVSLYKIIKNNIKFITKLEGHESEVKSIDWSNDGSLLATCSRDKSIWIWDKNDDDDYECASFITQHTQDVKKVIKLYINYLTIIVIVF